MFALPDTVYEIITFQMVCIRIYDLQKVGQYHELHTMSSNMSLDGVLMASKLVQNSGFISNHLLCDSPMRLAN